MKDAGARTVSLASRSPVPAVLPAFITGILRSWTSSTAARSRPIPLRRSPGQRRASDRSRHKANRLLPLPLSAWPCWPECRSAFDPWATTGLVLGCGLAGDCAGVCPIAVDVTRNQAADDFLSALGHLRALVASVDGRGGQSNPGHTSTRASAGQPSPAHHLPAPVHHAAGVGEEEGNIAADLAAPAGQLKSACQPESAIAGQGPHQGGGGVRRTTRESCRHGDPFHQSEPAPRGIAFSPEAAGPPSGSGCRGRSTDPTGRTRAPADRRWPAGTPAYRTAARPP